MNKDKPIKPRRITKENYRKVMSDLGKHEKLVLEKIMEPKGTIFQSDLVGKTELGKVTRIPDKLEGRDLVERKKRGNDQRRHPETPNGTFMGKEKLPELGKIDPRFFNRVIYPRLGADDDSIILKPQHGVDFGVVDLGDKVLVASTDPFYIAPALGWEKAAWFAVHILASDVAVSGIKPGYLTIDLNLPPEMSEDTLETIWKTVDSECKKLGISVLTGHTGRYAGCNYPMVGGATMFGIAPKHELIIPKAAVGDKIIISKGPAVETTGLFAMQFPEFLERAYGKGFVKKAQDVFYQMSTVKDALLAAKAGGVTAMHDATECGVFGGFYEIAQAGGVGMKVSLEDIDIQDVIKKTCECFGIDPYTSISEGTLIATVRPEDADDVVSALRKEDIPAGIVGEVLPREKGIVISEGSKERKLEHPRVDPFWTRFEEYLKKQNAEG